MVYEKSSFWIEADRTAPFAIKCAGGWRKDKKYRSVVEVPDVVGVPDMVEVSDSDYFSGFNPFWILPASFTKEITTDVELRKLIIKPPVFNILAFYKVEPDTENDRVYLEGYMKPVSYKIVDSGECYVYLNIKIHNRPLLGSEGRLFVTEKRKLTVSLEDLDGHGVFIPAGSRLDVELMVLDVNAVRALKTINSQNLIPPSLFVPKEVEERVDENDQEFFKTPELPNGFINTGSPTFIYPILARNYDGGSDFPAVGAPVDEEMADEEVLEALERARQEKVNFGERTYPVDLVWMGFYRRRKKCLIGV